jgi:hypothetical protein
MAVDPTFSEGDTSTLPVSSRKRPKMATVQAVLLLSVLSAVAPVGVTEEQPQCRHPAPVHGHFDAAAPNCTVIVRKDLSQAAMARRLATKYNFTPWVFHIIHGFAAQHVTVEMVSNLRCEKGVESIEYDLPTSAN